jgi:hypothetical protein
MLDFRETDGLFDKFEVNREPFWPRISWLVAGSGVWHLVLLACVVLIPPVRDALSLAALFQGAGFVDKAYKKTQIADEGDLSEITGEKFRYPDGYFLIDQQGMPIQQFPITPAFTPPPFTPSKAAAPAPTPVPSPVASPSPAIAASSPAASPAVKAAADKATAKTNADKKAAADEKTAAKGQKELEDASKQTGIDLPKEGEINKAPFKDLAVYATGLKDKGQLDFEKPFEVVIETTLDKDGKLVNPRVSRKAGDENLVDLGTRLVAAMNDSGILFYLKKINEDKPGTKVVFTIKQDTNEVIATVESEVTSADSARTLAAGFKVLLAAGAKARAGKDEEILIQHTTVTADQKNIVFKLNMAHKDVVDIVKKGMAEPTPTPS